MRETIRKRILSIDKQLEEAISSEDKQKIAELVIRRDECVTILKLFKR